jgi:hypothetical protein
MWACAPSSRRCPGWPPHPLKPWPAFAASWPTACATCPPHGEPVPVPLADRRYSGEFKVRIPPEQHRRLAIEASEQGVSLNRLVSAKLASGA